DVRHAGWREPHQEVGESIGAGARVGHGAARVAPVDCETVYCSVANKVSTHLQAMFTEYPGIGIAEGQQVLVQRTVRIASDVSEVGEPYATGEEDRRVTKGLEFVRPDDGAIGSDRSLVEADAAKETSQSRIAMAAKSLMIEAGTRFVDDI